MFDNRTRDFVGRLMELGYRAPAGDFKQEAMELLQGLIPFDMALWASGHTQGIRVHNAYLYGLPADMLQTWERFKHQDKLLANIIAQPGVTLDIHEFFARQERHSLEIYKQHSRAYGIENAVSTALPDPLTGLLDVMSLYRRRAEQPFSPEERAAKQFVFPLLTKAWHHNQIDYVRSRSDGQTGGAAAICDQEGWLRHAEARFMELLASEWPQWRASVLPEPLLAWLGGDGKAAFKGDQVVLLASRLDDLTLLLAHPRGALALLTPREEQVAESFGAGLTYKDISRELSLSPSTVRRHLESIYKKLEVSNKIELSQALTSD
jgi:DNA-binding CsgD family transcriptional regulator